MVQQGLSKTLFIIILLCGWASAVGQDPFKKAALPSLSIDIVSGKLLEGETLVVKAIPKNFDPKIKFQWTYSINGKKYNEYTATVSVNNLPTGKITFYIYAEDSKGRDIRTQRVLTIKPRPVIESKKDLDLAGKLSKESANPLKMPPPTIKISGPSNVKTTDMSIILYPIVVTGDNRKYKYFWSQWNGTNGDYEINAHNQLILKTRKVGDYRFKLRILDEKNQEYETAHNLKIVEALKPSVQVANKNNTIQLPTDAISITAEASDIDGYISSYRWSQISGSMIFIKDPSTKTLALTQLKAGQYSFKVVVSDNDGLTGESVVNISVNSPVVSNISIPPTKDKIQHILSTIPRLKGGPGNAFVNLLLPGLGHYYVSGDYAGYNRKKGSFLITFAYLGAATGAVYYKLKSNSEYAKYKELANYRDIQYDASGRIIGSRGILATNADQSYNIANQYNQTYTAFLMAGGVILATDFIYTLIKGSKNRNQYKKFFGVSNLRIIPIPGTNEITASVVLSF